MAVTTGTAQIPYWTYGMARCPWMPAERSAVLIISGPPQLATGVDSSSERVPPSVSLSHPVDLQSS